jgi:dTDP-4-amino-4,6-dideoxygalactose transaminase
LHEFQDYKIIDSAQKVNKNQFKKEANDNDLMIFSFYPTKPVGSSDGGIIVSNDFEKIKWFKEATMNGMTYAHNNWDRTIKFPGYKMYMNSIQCYIANKNLNILDNKKSKLKLIRQIYNKELGYNNTSDHLYRIKVNDNKKFIKNLKNKNIVCGIHYDTLHKNTSYNSYSSQCPKSTLNSKQTVSIPFNESLTTNQINYIIETIKNEGYIHNS